MKLDKPISSFAAAALLCGSFTLAAQGQTEGQTAAAPAASSHSSQTAPLSEDALRARLVGKLMFLRGFYSGDDLQFDENGKVDGSPAATSFTLSAIEIRKVRLSKRKLDIEAERYGLHFFGALPYEDDSKPFDKVKISKRLLHISIERELVVIPKVKKGKNAPKNPAQSPSSPAPGNPGAPEIAATPSAAAATVGGDARTTTSPAHSAMLMNAALDNIFAADIDQRMLARLPDFWQQYFKSKNQHREFMPADTHIQPVSGDITPPKVLNSIDPSSNEYAQKYGIAGLTLFRTVVDATGTPQEIAIARPIGFGLDEKAVDAIKKSRFTPATQNGRPVPVVIDVVVTFRIYSNRTKPGSVPKGSKETVLAASASDAEASRPSAKMLQ